MFKTSYLLKGHTLSSDYISLMDGSKKSANNLQTEAKVKPVEVRISAGTQAVEVISISTYCTYRIFNQNHNYDL